MAVADLVTVEPVAGGKALARLVELPQALHGRDERWAPPVMAWERYRVDHRRHPYLERTEATFLLARLAGRPAGRIVAHVAPPVPHGETDTATEPDPEGRFGFWWCTEEPAVARALVEAAQAWLTEQGCSSMHGPLSWEHGEEAGVQVAGHEVPGLTGRPWHPPHLAALLEDAGGTPEEDLPTWRIDLDDEHLAEERGAGDPEAGEAGEGRVPDHAGAYRDPRLVAPDGAAVPDLAEALRRTGLRGAWKLAARARRREWTVATVVRCDGPPALVVPALATRARDAGYGALVAPWTPDPGAPPEAVHRTYRFGW